MHRWKWFQRPGRPVDVIERTSFPEQTGAYRAIEAPKRSKTRRQAAKRRNQQAGRHDA